MNLIRLLGAVGLVAGTALPTLAQQPPRLEVRTVAPRTPGMARARAFATIQGNALTANNGQLPNVTVRLRDARFGRIIAMQVTDKAGMFVFRDLDPGTYIVELLG